MEREPVAIAASTISSGEAASWSRSDSRALEMSQFWQNLQVRLHPAVPNERTGVQGRKASAARGPRFNQYDSVRMFPTIVRMIALEAANPVFGRVPMLRADNVSSIPALA